MLSAMCLDALLFTLTFQAGLHELMRHVGLCNLCTQLVYYLVRLSLLELPLRAEALRMARWRHVTGRDLTCNVTHGSGVCDTRGTAVLHGTAACCTCSNSAIFPC